MEFTALKAGKVAATIMDWCFNNSRKKRQLAPPPEVLYTCPSPEKCCCHFVIIQLVALPYRVYCSSYHYTVDVHMYVLYVCVL